MLASLASLTVLGESEPVTASIEAECIPMLQFGRYFHKKGFETSSISLSWPED